MTPGEKRKWNAAREEANKAYKAAKRRYDEWIAAGNAADGAVARQLYLRQERALKAFNAFIGRV